MINIKEKLIFELQRNDIPDLKFIFSEEVLKIAPDLLKEFLEIDKSRFEELLKIENKDLTFESFEYKSLLDLFWSLLNHFQMVNNT